MKKARKKALIIFGCIFGVIAISIPLAIPLVKRALLNALISRFANDEYRSEIATLNGDWTLPETLEKSDVDVKGLAAYFLRHKGQEKRKILLNLHGGAYIMSLDDYPEL